MKRYRLVLFLLFVTVLTLFLCSCGMFGFECMHCHQYKYESPHHITEKSVDMDVCDECYQDYKAGKWSILH